MRATIILPGLMETPDDWADVVHHLPRRANHVVRVVDLTELTHSWRDFSIAGCAAQVVEAIRDVGTRPVNLVGLSLGGVVALRIAADHPELVSSIYVSGAQVKPPRVLMAAQYAVMAVLPARMTCPPGMGKPELLGILREMAKLDMVDDARRITARTRVVCGSKDRPNLSASRLISHLIPGAQYAVIDGGGHQWQKEKPREFADDLMHFIGDERAE